MRTSQNGIEMIKEFEGCRWKAYRCAAGVWTIGYGHTAGVRPGQKITQAQADCYLSSDVIKYEKKVEKYDERYGWNQNEFDALVSFAYNVGSIDQLTANGTRSRSVIAKKMLSYNKAAGRVLTGLSQRRKKEKELFCTPMGESRPLPETPAPDTSTHVQLNYRAGDTYVTQTAMRVRDKPSTTGRQIGSLESGAHIKNLATTRVGVEIWMYLGTDSNGREKWVCTDNGLKVYVC